jgi:hypothetical protein
MNTTFSKVSCGFLLHDARCASLSHKARKGSVHHLGNEGFCRFEKTPKDERGVNDDLEVKAFWKKGAEHLPESSSEQLLVNSSSTAHAPWLL